MAKIDIPDGTQEQIHEIIGLLSMRINNAKMIIAVAVDHLLEEIKADKNEDASVAQLVSEIYDLQTRKILGDQLRNINKKDRKDKKKK